MDDHCPYCGKPVEICHDDDYGMSEDQTFQQDCAACGKIFIYTTHISVDHELEQAPCLNGDAPHNFQLTRTYPVEFTKMKCTVCEEERTPTDEEMAPVLETDARFREAHRLSPDGSDLVRVPTPLEIKQGRLYE